jgi:hypothetical protein
MISLDGERMPQERTLMITLLGSSNPFINYPVLYRLNFTQLNTFRILIGLNSGFGHHFGSMIVVPHNGSSRTMSAPWADMIIRPDGPRSFCVDRVLTYVSPGSVHAPG